MGVEERGRGRVQYERAEDALSARRRFHKSVLSGNVVNVFFEK